MLARCSLVAASSLITIHTCKMGRIAEAQELLDILPEWILEDEPKIVNSLLVRLFRGVKVMADKKIVPVLRN